MTINSVITAEALRHFHIEVLKKVSVPQDDAEVLADVLLEADLRGIHNHGVALLPRYLRGLQSGGINPRPQIRVISETSSQTLLDGDGGLGHVVSVRAMQTCMDKAKKVGVAVSGVRNSNAFGRAAYYAAMALEKDLIGFATTNGFSLLTPPGGANPVVGNNPFALAFPAGQEVPVVIDMAMSVVALGKIKDALLEGRSLPPGWGLDKEGKPTSDAAEALESGRAPAVGDHKGFCLALAMDVLAGVLTGARFGRYIPFDLTKDPSWNRALGQFFLALDPNLFMPVNEFKARMDNLIQQVKRSSPPEAAEPVRLPGEIEYWRRQQWLKEGISLPPSSWQDIETIATEHDIRVPRD